MSHLNALLSALASSAAQNTPQHGEKYPKHLLHRSLFRAEASSFTVCSVAGDPAPQKHTSQKFGGDWKKLYSYSPAGENDGVPALVTSNN
jgi:hypothetical protein